VVATARIAAEGTWGRVVILTTYDGDADILPAIEAGATGYLLKDAPREELFRALAAAAEGKPLLAPGVAARLMRRVRAPEEALSGREVEVLRLAARGASNREIARALFVSEATVKTHLVHVYRKLSVADRTAAVTEGLKRGLIALEEGKGR
jgi:DNA-binding NarL/FixJ family response regulator